MNQDTLDGLDSIRNYAGVLSRPSSYTEQQIRAVMLIWVLHPVDCSPSLAIGLCAPVLRLSEQYGQTLAQVAILMSRILVAVEMMGTQRTTDYIRLLESLILEQGEIE